MGNSNEPVLKSSRSYVDRVSVKRTAWLRMSEVRKFVELAEHIPDGEYVTVEGTYPSVTSPGQMFVELIRVAHEVPVKENDDAEARREATS